MKGCNKFLLLFSLALIVLFFGAASFLFTSRIEANTLSINCEPLGGISHNYKCTGTPPSKLICAPIGACFAQCRDKSGGDTVRFGENNYTWYCCNASQPSSSGNCTIPKSSLQIDLLNPPACEPDQKKPHVGCKNGVYQSVDSCGIDGGELGAPCQEKTSTPIGVSGERPKGKLELNWPLSPMRTPLNDESSLTDLIKYLYEWAIGLGGLAAFIALIWAGVQYLTSAGSATKMKDSLDRIKSAALGLVLLLGTVLILNTINPQLTELKMPPISPGSKGLDSINAGEVDLLTEKCTGATLYRGINYEQPYDELPILVGKTKFTEGREIGSVKMIGSCQVYLSPFPDCSEPSASPSGSTANIGLGSGGAKTFKCAQLNDISLKTSTATP